MAKMVSIFLLMKIHWILTVELCDMKLINNTIKCYKIQNMSKTIKTSKSIKNL